MLALLRSGGEHPGERVPLHTLPDRMPMPRIALLALLLAAACGTPESAAPEPPPAAAAPVDTVRTDARVDAVQRRLDQAQKDADARTREALEAAEPR